KSNVFFSPQKMMPSLVTRLPVGSITVVEAYRFSPCTKLLYRNTSRSCIGTIIYERLGLFSSVTCSWLIIPLQQLSLRLAGKKYKLRSPRSCQAGFTVEWYRAYPYLGTGNRDSEGPVPGSGISLETNNSVGS